MPPATVSSTPVISTGGTFSGDLVTTGGAFPSASGYKGGANMTSDVFVAIFDPSKTGSASLLYGTYLGGSGAVGTLSGAVNFSLPVGDVSAAIAVDGSGRSGWQG
jgi:hypothetical protein